MLFYHLNKTISKRGTTIFICFALKAEFCILVQKTVSSFILLKKNLSPLPIRFSVFLSKRKIKGIIEKSIFKLKYS